MDHAMIRQLTRIARRTGFSVATTVRRPPRRHPRCRAPRPPSTTSAILRVAWVRASAISPSYSPQIARNERRMWRKAAIRFMILVADQLTNQLRSATPVMSEDTLLPFDLPSVARKKVSVGFDGGQLSSDAGVLLLRGVERNLGLAERLASCMRDRRKPERIEHPLDGDASAADVCDRGGLRGCQRLQFATLRSDFQDGGRACAGERRSICARSPPCRGWRMRRRRSRSPG